MISFRELFYELAEPSSNIFTRLTWAVENMDSLFEPLASGTNRETRKDWIGVLNNESKSFALMTPRKFFGFFPLQIVGRGQIDETPNGSRVDLKFRLGWYTLILLGMMYLTCAFVIGLTVGSEKLEDYFKMLLWILVFPGLWTFLIHRKMGKMEAQLDFLFAEKG